MRRSNSLPRPFTGWTIVTVVLDMQWAPPLPPKAPNDWRPRCTEEEREREINTEREGERERYICMYVYVCVYMHVYMSPCARPARPNSELQLSSSLLNCGECRRARRMLERGAWLKVRLFFAQGLRHSQQAINKMRSTHSTATPLAAVLLLALGFKGSLGSLTGMTL